MSTSAKGTKFERQVLSLLQAELTSSRLGVIPAQAKSYHQRAYFSAERARDIKFEIALEVTLPGQNDPSFLWRWECKRYGVAPGCYRVGPSPFPFLWIAANELPLLDELVPFLIARSGRALDAFVHWVKTRRPLDWIIHVRPRSGRGVWGEAPSKQG